MIRRAIAAGCVAVVIGCGLAGCQSAAVGSFSQPLAQADVAAWTTQAVRAAGGSGSAEKFNAFDACRSDTGYLPTSSQWRTITDVDVPLRDQAAATRAIDTAFERAHWKLSTPDGAAKLTGPDNQERRGLIIVQSAGSSQLAISVTSPCYG